MAVAEWGRWAFINIGMVALPLGDLISSIVKDSSATWQPSQEFQELGNRLEKTDYKKLKFALRKEYKLNCNWKVYVDNYLDGGYHVEQLHKSLNAQVLSFHPSSPFHDKF